MPMQKAKDLRTKTVEELHALLEEGARERYELRNELGMSRKIGKPHRVKELRKERARILTVLNETKGSE